ncbi:heterodisulfide reductase [Desulfobacter hydrogenophilus]|uniref:Heterodisulfide reductase n=1 Tax=Desulfobacter hydrogenophilus TaxID=2291 RepID=A0A328F8C7_9BACT|nr:CoB--CoM heterodisulfide reductase iron-sulfur subunit B family protein [Desulfobacter hydrogenophilus]NDY73012.1 heterodisulfide reductase [Desulfobacter hydrogenophilus]QBH15215.1 heterodisulfide reductase [Desulfobacter hydrogenophilus]RAM00954.1 heterodisulfide reductase [Desulfobacter hydrogenophilus]
MKCALFSGCRTGFDIPQHPTSAKAVLSRLNVKVEELEFGCCGYPVKEKNLDAFLLLSIRNLAIAQAHNLPVLTLCKCCFGALKQAEHYFQNDWEKRVLINSMLQKEGLHYKGGVKIHHMLTLLDREIDKGVIQRSVIHPLDGIKVAASYGCHALRPSTITGLDDRPNAPTIFERIITLTGAEPVNWSKGLECCGNPLLDKNSALARDFILKKYETAKQEGADIICTACNYCHMQFEHGRDLILKSGSTNPIPAILLTQLLGQAMGLEKDLTGVETAA